jgi:ribonuclease T2
VLALSWSPSFCLTEASTGEALQCGGPRSYAFVLHGLWPQHERQSPAYCDTEESSVPTALFETVRRYMPSPRLVRHQWRKHGSCSGLSMRGYFELAAALFEKVRIPARYLAPTRPIETDATEIETDFAKTNRGLHPDMITLTCRRHRGRARLEDVRICFTPGGKFTPCGRREGQSCEGRNLVLPPLRSARRSTAPDDNPSETP